MEILSVLDFYIKQYLAYSDYICMMYVNCVCWYVYVCVYLYCVTGNHVLDVCLGIGPIIGTLGPVVRSPPLPTHSNQCLRCKYCICICTCVYTDD